MCIVHICVDIGKYLQKAKKKFLQGKDHNYFCFYHGNCKKIMILTMPMVNYHRNCNNHNYLTITMGIVK